MILSPLHQREFPPSDLMPIHGKIRADICSYTRGGALHFSPKIVSVRRQRLQRRSLQRACTHSRGTEQSTHVE